MALLDPDDGADVLHVLVHRIHVLLERGLIALEILGQGGEITRKLASPWIVREEAGQIALVLLCSTLAATSAMPAARAVSISRAWACLSSRERSSTRCSSSSLARRRVDSPR
jgi:hypothetical protein